MVVYPLKGTAFQSREMLDAHPKPFFVCLFFVMCFYPVLHLERDWVSILHLFNGELRNYLEFPNHIMLVFVLCRVFLHSHPALQIRWRYAPKQRCDPHRSVDHLILTSDIGWGPPKILLSKKLPGSDSRFRWLQ